MKAFVSIFIAFLLGTAIFSSYKYFSSISEKYELLNEVKRVKEQVAAIESQRERLIKDLDGEQLKQKVLAEENSGLKGQLKTVQENEAKMRAELESTRQTLEELKNLFAVAKAENAALNKQVSDLKSDADTARQEKEALASRLNSLRELKKAMRELKRKIGGARKEIDTRIKNDRIIIGNGGYMIKDGRPTYPARVKIEVVPLPAQNP